MSQTADLNAYTSRITWHYLPNVPHIPDGEDSIVVMASRKFKNDSKPVSWMVRFHRKKGWRALVGHPVKGIYAWAYLPEVAPELEVVEQP